MAPTLACQIVLIQGVIVRVTRTLKTPVLARPRRLSASIYTIESLMIRSILIRSLISRMSLKMSLKIN